MQLAALEALERGRYALSGDLVFDQVTRLLGEGDTAFAMLPHAEVDLAKVQRVDSAGLALLLEWSIVAREGGRTIHYRNVPPALSALAGISDVSALLVATAPGAA